MIADLVDVTRMHTADPEHRVPHLAFQPDQLADVPFLPMGEVETSYYLRMRVRGQARRARRHHAHPRRPRDLDRRDDPEGAVAKARTRPTSSCSRTVRSRRTSIAAIAKIEALPTVRGKIVRIRLEELN